MAYMALCDRLNATWVYMMFGLSPLELLVLLTMIFGACYAAGALVVLVL